MERTVMPIHFEDRSGEEFERLCYAYLLNCGSWKNLEWIGQSGCDGGRDIVGVNQSGDLVVVQCANHKSLRFKKIESDFDKILKSGKLPKHFILVTGGKVSAKMRSKIKDYVKAKGTSEVEIWSGVEFEERLRRDSPFLIKRFSEGVAFPETEGEFESWIRPKSDLEILEQMAFCFERPAFTTPLQAEVNFSDFEKAITDTIEALSTGVCRLRDGTFIRRISSRADLKNPGAREGLGEVIEGLIELRYAYITLEKSGSIKKCGCQKPDCTTICFDLDALHRLESLRSNVRWKFESLKKSVREEKSVQENVSVVLPKEPYMVERCKTGRALWEKAFVGILACEFNLPEELDDEAEELAARLQISFQEWMDIYQDVTPMEHLECKRYWNSLIKELETLGYGVYGSIIKGKLVGGTSSKPSPWPHGVVAIRKEDP